MNIDWSNLILGGIVGAVLAPIPAIIIRLGFAAFGKGPSNSILGEWISAEYDSKSPDAEQRNTILRVRVKRRLDGKITVEALEGLVHANPKRPTSWRVVGVIEKDVLVGTWRSTVAHSTRHGTVLLKFCDDGRAIGYYLGVAEACPVYGYWLMSRDENDLRQLAEAVLKRFRWNDLKGIVDKNDPRQKTNKHPEAEQAVTPNA